MNGAVVDAMRSRGLDYPLSYGVSVPTIREIAKAYAPAHAFALFLFRQQVRELKLAAAFIDDPSEVTAAQMREWADGLTIPSWSNRSLAPCSAMRLMLRIWLWNGWARRSR